MENKDIFPNVFTTSLLIYYSQLVDMNEYGLLKSSFYYNFENFAINYPNREIALCEFIAIICRLFDPIRAKEISEILDLEKLHLIIISSYVPEDIALEA